ncbi:MAG: PQQ-binding-like beta-propeller repeat protein [Sedimentisphaerales bacterium]|nr:PQQ-binding-like beta-propeller repeat protein [Sedimentisphaerales bacterium]
MAGATDRFSRPGRRLGFGLALWLCLGGPAGLGGADWPQFRGPNRDGRSPETGLLGLWPENGPPLLWTAQDIGEGWSSAAIAAGCVYITGQIDGNGYLFCFDTAGAPLWKVPYGREWTRSYPASRTTPTIRDGRIYVFSGLGVVSCFAARDGQPLWSRDVVAEFEGQYPQWGLSECLLIDGENVICTPGGTKASVVALDRTTGAVRWACTELTEPSAYGNPQIVEYRGNRLIVTMLRDSVVGIDAAGGALLWRQSFDDYHTDRQRLVNPNVPLYHDGGVYTTSGYNNGGAMIRLFADPRKVQRLWTDKTLDTHHGGQVLLDGHIYGSSWTQNTRGDWVCLDWDTGRVVYEDSWQSNKGSIIYADGRFYCVDENQGNVALVAATTEGFRPISAFRVTRGKGKYWAHPSIADGRLYLRHGAFLMAYDIRGQ